jgi:hypothetical protein
MKPGKYDLDPYRGDSYEWWFRLWNDAAKTEPIDITGATAAAEIRNKPAGEQIAALECTVEAPNTVHVELAPDLWPAIPATGSWDLQVTFPDGTVNTYVAGRVVTTADVTGSTPP